MMLKQAYAMALLALVHAYAKQKHMSKSLATQQAIGLLKHSIGEGE